MKNAATEARRPPTTIYLKHTEIRTNADSDRSKIHIKAVTATITGVQTNETFKIQIPCSQ